MSIVHDTADARRTAGRARRSRGSLGAYAVLLTSVGFTAAIVLGFIH